jgi:hypothetical protein
MTRALQNKGSPGCLLMMLAMIFLFAVLGPNGCAVLGNDVPSDVTRERVDEIQRASGFFAVPLSTPETRRQFANRRLAHGKRQRRGQGNNLPGQR